MREASFCKSCNIAEFGNHQLTDIMSSLIWDHLKFKLSWVIMKLVPYDGVLIKEYVSEILKHFDKFQVVTSLVKVFTTNLNGLLSPTVSRPRGCGRASSSEESLPVLVRDEDHTRMELSASQYRQCWTCYHL